MTIENSSLYCLFQKTDTKAFNSFCQGKPCINCAIIKVFEENNYQYPDKQLFIQSGTFLAITDEKAL